MKIYKYPINIVHKFTHYHIPDGGRIIHVALQNDLPYMWVLVDPDKPDGMPRDFQVFGTGHEISDEEFAYIATFQQPPYVWHLFEKEL